MFIVFWFCVSFYGVGSARFKFQEDLELRLIKYKARVERLFRELPKTRQNINVISQGSRSVSSIGANYREACASESARDFLHKATICLKEAKESKYWLLVIYEENLRLRLRMEGLLSESEEIIKIFGKIVSTTRKRLTGNWLVVTDYWLLTDEETSWFAY